MGVRTVVTQANGGLFRGINVVSISVTDLGRARAFYGETLGLGAPLYDLPEAGWIEFSTGGSTNISVTPLNLVGARRLVQQSC
jgi:hypothetical protein